MISTDKTDNIGSRETAVIKADGVKADSSEAVKAEFTVTSYEKYGDNSVKQEYRRRMTARREWHLPRGTSKARAMN